jgi:transcription elongation factor B subunit 1
MPKQPVKLVSSEGHEFIIDYKAACVSNTIRNMLSSQGQLCLLGEEAATERLR